MRRNRIPGGHEAAIKQGMVLPILVLGRLGWDRGNVAEVVPECAVGNGRVDYCLMQNGVARVFLEVR